MQDPFEEPTKTKKYLKIATFGDGGSGKTRFALSFPKPSVIDAEHGTDPYKKSYSFRVSYLNRWRQLRAPIEWLRDNPGIYETLIIDPATVFYQDLIQDIVDAIKNKRGNETLTRGDWGVQKRRWAAFMNLLVELPMHVILNFREKPEYLESTDRNGEEILRKTGNFMIDADRQTKHLFDLSFRCYTEVDKKTKTPRFLMQVDKTRYNEWMPLYTVLDITGKRAYGELFEKQVKEMLKGKEPGTTALSSDPFEDGAEKPTQETVAQDAKKLAQATSEVAAQNQEAAEAEDLPEENPRGVKAVGQMLNRFTSTGDPEAPKVTQEEIKVLMTRVTDVKWPDGSSFQNADGKKMIKALFDADSTKDLKKHQADFLYNEFGEVLAERAELARDEEGVPYVRRLAGVKIPELSKK